MTPPSDFVQVQLSAAGVAFAGTGGQVRIANGHFAYLFSATKPVRVLTSEWSRTLSRKTFNGAPILMIAPTPVPAQPTPSPAPLSHTNFPSISHRDGDAAPIEQVEPKAEVK